MQKAILVYTNICNCVSLYQCACVRAKLNEFERNFLFVLLGVCEWFE